MVVTVDWFFVSHRLPIALAAIQNGYEVTVTAVEEAGKGDFIRKKGIHFIPLPTTRSGMNIFKEWKVLWFLFKLYRKTKPDIIHHVGVKPVTYGSLVAKFLSNIKVVNALSGMGFLFINAPKNKWAHHLVLAIFKWSFKNKNIRFILQNEDDLKMVESLQSLESDQLFLIKGSGVDTNMFSYSKEIKEVPIKIVLPARMLWDKGVGEFVGAAQLLYPKYKNKVIFHLCGPIDSGNRAGISEKQLLEWQNSKVVSWLGNQTDMVRILKNAHIIVLPSYREGLPKALIEACAIGRPIITTDAPGCRTVVQDGQNGFLIPVKNTRLLADAIEKLIVDKDLRCRMGQIGRQIAEREFKIETIVSQTIAIYENP